MRQTPEPRVSGLAGIGSGERETEGLGLDNRTAAS